MKIIFLLLLILILYFSIGIFYGKFKKDLIYILAIGGAVNSNIFNISSYPIYIGNLIFGVDSILYTLFIFCIIIIYFYFGKKEAVNLTHTSIISILFGAIIQLIASYATFGFESEFISTFVSFLVSVFATLCAVYLMLYFLEKLKHVNKFVLCGLALLLASIVNSTIYFSIVAITSNLQENFIPAILGSYVGKIISMIFSVICFIVIDVVEKKRLKRNNIKLDG